MSDEKRLVIGVDIGGTIIKSGVVEFSESKAKVIKEVSVATPNATAVDIAKLVARQVNILCHSYPDITDAGIGVPGSLDKELRLVRYPPNFPLWNEEPLAELIKKELPHFEKVAIDNDANAATRAEAIYGSGVGEEHFVMITLGTGVGGGLWMNGDVFRGEQGGAGEFGHISISYNGERCNCGAVGCIEAYIGKEYLVKRTITKLLDRKITSSLQSLLPPKLMEPKDISHAASTGDEFAKDVLHEAGEMLGTAMASAAKLLDVRTFIVTGGIAEAGEMLLESARRTLIENVFANQKESIKVLLSALRNKAGIIGAGLLVR